MRTRRGIIKEEGWKRCRIKGNIHIKGRNYYSVMIGKRNALYKVESVDTRLSTRLLALLIRPINWYLETSNVCILGYIIILPFLSILLKMLGLSQAWLLAFILFIEVTYNFKIIKR